MEDVSHLKSEDAIIQFLTFIKYHKMCPYITVFELKCQIGFKVQRLYYTIFDFIPYNITLHLSL